MGVAARNNSSGYRSYLDTGIRTVRTDYSNQPSAYYSFNASNRLSHVTDKSVVVKNGLTSIGGGKRFRVDSGYSRSIMDSPLSYNIQVTEYLNNNGTWYERRTERDLWQPPFEQLQLQSSNHGVYWPNDNADAVNQAITQALNKLGDQKVNIGAALAESKKTFDMIADATTGVFRAYRSLRKGNFASVAKHLGLSKSDFMSGRSSANYLLAMKYGVAPLLGDIYNGYQWFVDNKETPLLLRVKSASSRTTSVNGTSGSTTWTGEASHIGFCGITAKVSGDFQRGINRGGLANPAAIAWEIVPFSFLVDWFIPVGNVLQAYSDSAGLTFISGYTGTKNESSVTFVRKYRAYTPGLTRETGDASAELRGFSTRRTVLGAFPRPGLYAKQNVFNLNKASTALALLRSVMR